ncbi:hypothetical protein (Partial), partial [Seminavis robusta]|eukprot:Sro3944_g352040.1 n/a (326) ;mRNA; r:131-1108
MSSKRKSDKKVQRAAMLLKLSKKGSAMTVNQAMEFAGYEDDELGNQATKKAIYRARDSMETPEKKPQTSRALVAVPANEPPPHGMQAPVARRIVHAVAPTAPSKMRLTCRQAYGQRQHDAEQKKLRQEIFLEACNMWKEECDKKEEAVARGEKYRPKSAEDICIELNQQHKDVLDKRISPRTVREHVKDGRVGGLQRRGPKGRIPEDLYRALCDAIKSYAILSQQEATKVSNLRPGLIKKLNAVVKSKEGPDLRPGRKLFERIERDVADEIDLGKPNRIEQRRAKWSTYSNINQWFTAFKDFLVQHGFAEHVPEEEWAERGELVFG